MLAGGPHEVRGHGVWRQCQGGAVHGHLRQGRLRFQQLQDGEGGLLRPRTAVRRRLDEASFRGDAVLNVRWDGHRGPRGSQALLRAGRQGHPQFRGDNPRPERRRLGDRRLLRGTEAQVRRRQRLPSEGRLEGHGRRARTRHGARALPLGRHGRVHAVARQRLPAEHAPAPSGRAPRALRRRRRQRAGARPGRVPRLASGVLADHGRRDRQHPRQPGPPLVQRLRRLMPARRGGGNSWRGPRPAPIPGAAPGPARLACNGARPANPALAWLHQALHGSLHVLPKLGDEVRSRRLGPGSRGATGRSGQDRKPRARRARGVSNASEFAVQLFQVPRPRGPRGGPTCGSRASRPHGFGGLRGARGALAHRRDAAGSTP
mmetsp:Transcript_32777/g.65015  ORF Transcript_32777/g.65015 Transcript_32777/m.65015 type:complete len:375 (+) Transcript_32777:792-1916(+)